MKKNSPVVSLLLANTYNSLPEELSAERKGVIELYKNYINNERSQWLSRIYSSKNNLEKTIYHLIGYQNSRGNSKIEIEELLGNMGLSLFLKGVKIDSFLAKRIFR